MLPAAEEPAAEDDEAQAGTPLKFIVNTCPAVPAARKLVAPDAVL